MKNKLFTLAGALTLFAVLGHFYAKPLMAQVRAALIKNLDERGRNPYSRTLVCVAIQGGGCEADFPPVPAGMRLVVEYVDLSVQGDSPFQVQIFSGNSSYHPITQTLPATVGAAITSAVSQAILAYCEAGASVQIRAFELSGNPPLGGVVTISGYLVNLSE
jgi:hypothetical protein